MSPCVVGESLTCLRAHQEHAAIDHNGRSGDVTGGGCGQEGDGGGHLAGMAGPAERDARSGLGARVDVLLAGHRRGDLAGATELTVMPCSASSRARTLVSMPRPAFATQNGMGPDPYLYSISEPRLASWAADDIAIDDPPQLAAASGT
jgi:hypothetical protein